MSTILIIEDEQPIRLLMCVNLKQRGFDVIEAQDAEKGLAYLKRAIPWLIILDMQLPVMQGEDLLKIILSDRRLRTIPVIITSATSYKLEELQQKYSHVAVVLVKPFDVASLIETVNALYKAAGDSKST